MRVFSRRRALVLALLVVSASAAALAATNASRKAPRKKKAPPAQPMVRAVDYATEVKPLLEAHCTRCHGPNKQKGGLRLDTVAGVRKGGDSGGVIVPGNGANSPLVLALTGSGDQPRMPPTGEPLAPAQIDTLKRWIDEGAHAPPEPATEPAPAPNTHWAFIPPVAAPVPGAPGTHPIDAFLSVGREQRGLVPLPAAPPAVLLRRVYIDLIGLPPTREELRAFLKDESPDAYEKVVDRLLADPRYGERWARHWMDVWRYSEADGRASKADVWWSSPHIWRWRDWIVESVNADKGYDRMILEMLAGDELVATDEIAPGKEPPPVRQADLPALAATGFLVRNHFKLDRNVWMSNTVEHTAKAFLGLTIGCARCHDHKFDPVSQQDYARFRAFFEPHDIRTDAVADESGPAAHVARAYDQNPDAPTWVFVRGDPNSPDRTARMLPAIPPALGAAGPIAPRSGNSGRRLALAQWLTSSENPLTARVAVNHIWMRHFGKPLVENVSDFGVRTPAPVQQRLLDWLACELMAKNPTPRPPPPGGETSLTSPLSALVQRCCADAQPARHEGESGEVGEALRAGWGRRRSEGESGSPPTRRVQSDAATSPSRGEVKGNPPPLPPGEGAGGWGSSAWRMKHLHRLIVTSAAYKMRSSTRDAPARNLSTDPENAFYWRAEPRRMEAEVLRDALLHLAGTLEPTTGGPPVDTARGTETGRRSIYYRYSRNDKMEFLTAFDAPGVEECYRRERSIVPQQALALENSGFSWDQARRIARRLDDGTSNANFVIAAFEHVLGRSPEPAEATACESFLRRQEKLLADPSRLTPFPPAPTAPEPVKGGPALPLVFGEACPLPSVEPASEPAKLAREYLVHALLNHNDFITVR